MLDKNTNKKHHISCIYPYVHQRSTYLKAEMEFYTHKHTSIYIILYEPLINFVNFGIDDFTVQFARSFSSFIQI